MSDREPSLIELLLLTAWSGMQTAAEIVAVVVFIGAMLLAAKLLEPDRRASICTAGSVVALFSDCARR